MACSIGQCLCLNSAFGSDLNTHLICILLKEIVHEKIYAAFSNHQMPGDVRKHKLWLSILSFQDMNHAVPGFAWLCLALPANFRGIILPLWYAFVGLRQLKGSLIPQFISLKFFIESFCMSHKCNSVMYLLVEPLVEPDKWSCFSLLLRQCNWTAARKAIHLISIGTASWPVLAADKSCKCTKSLDWFGRQRDSTSWFCNWYPMIINGANNSYRHASLWHKAVSSM